MKPWPKHPVIYEINTWVVAARAERASTGRRSTWRQCPAQEWDVMAARGFDAVWFMGVWERSPAGIAISMQQPGPARGLQAGPSRLLGRRQRRLAVLRAPLRRRCAPRRAGRGWPPPAQALAARGVRLVLDFVPNHVAPDHPWVIEHPEYFVQGSADDLTKRPGLLRRGRREGVRLRPRPLLPGVARRAPAQRLSAGAPAGGGRHGLGHRRAVRRHPLRHGHAAAERHLRADLGRSRRRQAGRRLLARR